MHTVLMQLEIEGRRAIMLSVTLKAESNAASGDSSFAKHREEHTLECLAQQESKKRRQQQKKNQNYTRIIEKGDGKLQEIKAAVEQQERENLLLRLQLDWLEVWARISESRATQLSVVC